MARNIWNGSVSIDMLSFSVTMASGASESKLDFHQYDKHGYRVQYRRISGYDGSEVPYSEIQKGYEAPDGTVVMMTDDDFNKAYGSTERNAKILKFVDPASIPAEAFMDPYILEPAREKGRKKGYDRGSERAYALLADALKRTGRVALTEWGLRERKCLAAISADEDGYLWLTKLRFAQDMNKPDFPAPKAEFTEQEIELGVKFVEDRTSEFDHAGHVDNSREVLNGIIQARIEGVAPVKELKPAEGQGGAAAMSLVEMLQGAVAEHKKAA